MLLEEVGAPGAFGPVEQTDEAPAVHGRRNGNARQLGERRGEVDVERESRLPARERREARVAHDERDPHALLVWALLSSVAMLAPDVSVVGGEEDERVPLLAGLSQGAHDRADRLVDGEERFELQDPT